MNGRNREPRKLPAPEIPSAALSPDARVVGECLGRWRTRIAETQTLVRLTLSLLQGSTSITSDRRAHLGRLAGIEVRAVAQLPLPDFASLRSTTNARHSGIDLRGPDTVAAERYIDALRERVTAQLGEARVAIDDEGADPSARIESARATLDELARAVDLLETMMYPRLHNPPIEIGAAFERATAARGQRITVEGATNARVHQARGLMRLLSEIVSEAGDSAHAHATRVGGWVEVAVSPDATGHGLEATLQGRAELLRFAAYLIRAQAEFRDGAWHLAFVACAP